MRCVAKRKIELFEVDVEPPGPGQVQVSKKACGLCASDVHAFAHGPESLPFAATGHEGVGVVTEVGPGVAGIEVGEVVLGGGFQSGETLSAVGLLKVPVEATDYALWVVEPVACVVNGLDHAAVQAGDRVAMVGAGFMGLMMVQGLLRCPWSRLVVMDVDEGRLELARRFGAEEALNLSDPEGERQAGALAGQMDVVVDCSGVQAGLDRSTALLPRAGRLDLFGWVHGQVTFAGDEWHLKGLHVVNASPMCAVDMGACWVRAIRGLAGGLFDLEPLVTHRGPLSKLADLLAAGADKAGGYIKGVVVYDE